MTIFDAVIVGSGINSLVCAGILAKRGKKVCILEREATLGGCIRTEELTAPGFIHDTLSTAHSLFVTSPGYAELKDELHANGLEYCHSATPTGVLLPDGRSLLLTRDRATNIAAMNALAAGDGDAYAAAMGSVERDAETIFTLLGSELWTTKTGRTLAKRAWREGAHATLGFFGDALQSSRAWLGANFASPLSQALLAPWVLHTGLGPESAMSSLMAKVIAFTLEGVGLPLVKGGNARTVDAFRRLIEARGGEFHVNAEAAEIITQGGRATGVRTTDGRSFMGRNVVCNVTPTQLYGRLLTPGKVSPEITRQGKAFRYGKGAMQIHLALSEAPAWADKKLAEVIYLHLTSGLDGVSKAVNEAERGLLPDAGTICVCQPCAVDPSRAPDGKWIFWIQLPECPSRIAGDARGEIPAPADGRWTEAIREGYADRIIDRLAAHIPNLKSSIVGRKVLSPADLEALNINLVGGDPYSGDCAIDQSMFWRPLRGAKNHATELAGLYHIGASTHPGPGLGGGSGYLVADQLAKR